MLFEPKAVTQIVIITLVVSAASFVGTTSVLPFAIWRQPTSIFMTEAAGYFSKSVSQQVENVLLQNTVIECIGRHLLHVFGRALRPGSSYVTPGG